MSKGQKILTSALWGVVVLLMVGLIASWTGLRQQDQAATGNSGPVGTSALASDLPDVALPAFSLTDQAGKPFNSTAMQGRPWIVDFIFTRCGGPCPMMTSHMVKLQRELKGTGVQFLSLSVDPTFDTPEVLAKYGKERGADFANWTFATGNEDLIISVAKTLLLGVTPANGQAPIMHSTKFVLVDAHGKVHGYYSGTDPESLKSLAADARSLGAAEQPQERR